jgi:hypothetical protein
VASDKSDTQARCVLCDRTIRGKPFVKFLDGHRLEFDKSDCEAIFSRLASVYGTSFGLSLCDL